MIKCFEFEIKNSDKIQDVGFRLKIASRIPDDLYVRIDNIGDVVKVTAKGEEEKVWKFYENLKEELSRNPITFGPLNITPDAKINTDRFYHRLQCEQLGKFVDVGLEMRDAIRDLPKEISKAIKENSS